MYCSNCGCRVADGARFCSSCGSAVNQGAAQPAASRPVASQPAASRPVAAQNIEPLKTGGTLVYPDNRSDIGDFYITPQEIVFMKKSLAVRVAFGFLGSALQKGKESARIRIADVARGERTRIGLNKNVYQITMRNGDVYKLCMDWPKDIKYLESLIG